MRELSTQLHLPSTGHDTICDAKPPQPACELPHEAFGHEPFQPDAAIHYSHQHQYNREQVLAWLSEHVPPKRLQHILRVETMAMQLAHHHHQDVDRAAKAGLMHDLAKCFKPKHLLELAAKEGIAIDDVFAAHPHLLHADVGAIVARDEFGIEDSEILDAIRNHTLGSAGMSLLSCVVFLADSLEPGRGDTSELQALREVSWQNLYRAVWLTADYTLKYLIDSKSLIHPRALMTRNWAMQVATNAIH